MTANKVCPVVLRRIGLAIDVLAFEHPLAGYQLVKGTVESNESPQAAALRELAEEAGIASATIVKSLGIWVPGYKEQIWEFFECQPTQTLAGTWWHHAPDDGGHNFRFFWHPLSLDADPIHWHLVFRNALSFIRNAIAY